MPEKPVKLRLIDRIRFRFSLPDLGQDSNKQNPVVKKQLLQGYDFAGTNFKKYMSDRDSSTVKNLKYKLLERLYPRIIEKDYGPDILKNMARVVELAVILTKVNAERNMYYGRYKPQVHDEHNVIKSVDEIFREKYHKALFSENGEDVLERFRILERVIKSRGSVFAIDSDMRLEFLERMIALRTIPTDKLEQFLHEILDLREQLSEMLMKRFMSNYHREVVEQEGLDKIILDIYRKRFVEVSNWRLDELKQKLLKQKAKIDLNNPSSTSKFKDFLESHIFNRRFRNPRVIHYVGHADRIGVVYQNGLFYRNYPKDKLAIWKELYDAGLQVEPIVDVLEKTNDKRHFPTRFEGDVFVTSKDTGPSLFTYLEKKGRIPVELEHNIARQMVKILLGLLERKYIYSGASLYNDGPHNHVYNWTIKFEKDKKSGSIIERPIVTLIDFSFVEPLSEFKEDNPNEIIEQEIRVFTKNVLSKVVGDVEPYHKYMLSYLTRKGVLK